jgi:N-acetylmuramoyl-L-alanine amidase
VSLNRVWISSPNYSSRGGQSVRLIVLHSSEGATTYQSLGNFFANPSSQVSSHVGIDDTPNTIGEYVKRQNKAWTASGANPVSVQAELCCPSGASANWTDRDWHSHPTMLNNTAAWIAEEAAAYGIPIVRLSPASAQSGGRGVCQHRDLGSWGGGHYDLGVNFPIDDVIATAGGVSPGPSPTPPPTPTPTEDDEVSLTIAIGDDKTDGGRWYVTDMYSFKTYIPTAEAAAQIIWCTVAGGGKIYHGANNGPIAVSTDLLRNIPSKDDL